MPCCFRRFYARFAFHTYAKPVTYGKRPKLISQRSRVLSDQRFALCTLLDLRQNIEFTYFRNFVIHVLDEISADIGD